MQLYWNDKPIAGQATVDSIKLAVNRLRTEKKATVALRRGPSSSVSVHWGPEPAFMLEIQDEAALYGLRVPEEAQDAVVAVLLEYRGGAKPRLPLEVLNLKAPKNGLMEFVLGDEYDHDCPLCAMMGAEEVSR